MATQTERAVVDLVINGQQSQATMKQLTAGVIDARKALYSMAETDPGYKKQKKELEDLMRAQQSRIVKLHEEKTAWQKFTTGAGTITAGIVGGGIVDTAFSAIKNGIGDVITKYREYDAASKELSAVTGATGRDLEYLNKTAARTGPDVGKSAAEMLEAYKLMGSAKPELLANKEALTETTKAAITLSQAGMIDLASATTVTAESLNQFGEGADQANRYVNVIAAGAKEGSAEINEMGAALKNSGTVASSQNVSFEQTNAVLQSLSTIALKGGEAGTQLKNVLLTLGSGSDDTNPKVVGLEKALENLGKKNMSTAEMTKLFGKENIIAAQHIITHRGEIAELTKKVTGTQEAFSQAEKNNASFDHQLEVFYARLSGLAVLIGAHVIPAVTKLLEGGIAVAKFFTDGLTPASEKATDAFNDQRAKVQDLTKNLTPLLNRHDELKKKTVLTKDEQAELKKIVGQVADIVPSAVTEFDKYGNALGVNTEKAREFIKMQQQMLKYTNKKAIDENSVAKKDLEQERDVAVNKLNSGNTYERDATSMGGAYKLRKMTEDERKALRAEIAKLNGEIDDKKSLLTGLTGDYLKVPEAPKTTKPAATKPTGGGGGLSDKEKKARDKAEKKAEHQVDVNHEAILAIEKMNMEAIKDDRARELAQADYQANQEKEKARKSTATAKLKATWIKGIEDALVVDKLKINEKYDEEAQKKELKRLKDVQDLAEKELKIIRQSELAKIESRVASGGISKEQGKQLEIEAEQRFLVAKEMMYGQHYEAMANAAFGNDEAMKALAQDFAETVAGIDQAQLDSEGATATARQELRNQELEHEKDLLERKKQMAAEELAFRKQLQTELLSGLQNNWTGTIQGYKDFWQQSTVLQKAAFIAQKAYALAEIGINLARQITAVNTAAAVADAVIPFSGEIIRIKGLALAIGSAAVQTAAVVGIKGFAEGGFTDSDQQPSGYTKGPTYYKKGNYVAGEAGKEWIMSAPMLQNPVMANLAGALQALQVSGQYRNLSTNSAGTGAGAASQGGNTDALLAQLVSLTQQHIGATQDVANRPVKLNHFALEEVNKDVDFVREFTKG